MRSDAAELTAAQQTERAAKPEPGRTAQRTEAAQKIEAARPAGRTELPEVVRAYFERIESGAQRAGKDQLALAAMVRRCFETEDLRVDEKQLAAYLKQAKYFPYKDLFPWQKMLIALWLCTYDENGLPRWKTLLCMVSRGAGKDGFIAVSAWCEVSPYNPVPRYNVDICAMNEEQAITPVQDIVDALENPKNVGKLSKHFYHTKELVQGRRNKGIIKGRTNNPKGRDGMRSGMVVFNEVHAYENYNNIKVFVTGQGKTAQPRVGIFTSNGEINDGPLDDYLARGRRILHEGEPDNGFLPFICCLESEKQVHDPENWVMANPSLPFLPHLMQETADEYRDWLEHPEQNGDFLTKRMGIRKTFQEIAVTDYDKIKATNRPVPDLSGWSCTVGIDYAMLSDWASVVLHFRRGNDRLDIQHSWICAESKTLPLVKAPWQHWVDMGLCTYVQGPQIGPKLIAEYIEEAASRYHVVKLAADYYRWPLLAEAMGKIGFDVRDKVRVKLVRPPDIMMVDPLIQQCFDNCWFSWGNDPVLRWATNNTKRVRSSKSKGVDTGNFIYAKIEAKSRKTDPFMALVAAMTVEETLTMSGPVELPPVAAVAF